LLFFNRIYLMILF